MNFWFDIIIIGFTLLLGLKGIINGLIKEIFGLVGIIGGVFVASKFKQEVASFINDTFYKIGNEDLAQFVGFIAVLVIFWLLCLVIGGFLSKLIKLSGLGFLDRLGGFIFGAAKVFLIFAILVFCISRISFLNDKLEDFAKNSYTLQSLKNIGASVMNAKLSEEIIEKIEEIKIDTNSSLSEGENNGN